MGDNVGVNGKFNMAMEWVWRIATVIIIPLLFWMASTLRDIERRVSIIEANRPTRSEIIDLNSRLREEMVIELRLLRAEIREDRSYSR